jgi:hypothetical protein
MLVNVMIDPKNYFKKPTDVSASLKRLTPTSVLVSDLATQLVMPYGRSFMPAIMNGKGREREHWLEQQVFAMDFDNKPDKPQIHLDQIISRCEYYNIIPAFVHETFSSMTDGVPRYHAVFVLNGVIDNVRIRNVVKDALYALFPEADPSTSNENRLFFGGTTICYQSYKSVVDVEQLFLAAAAFIKQRDPKNAARNITSWCKDVGLNTINGLPAVLRIETSDSDEVSYKIEDLVGFQVIYKEKPPEIFKNVKYFINLSPESGVNTRNNKVYKHKDIEAPQADLIDVSNLEDLAENCPVMSDFAQGKDIHHDVTWWCLVNLLPFKGGEALFLKWLKMRDVYNVDKWKDQIGQLRKKPYMPANYSWLKSYYPDIDTQTKHRSFFQMAQLPRQKVVRFGKKFEDVDVVHHDLSLEIEKALDENTKDIYVFRADTGVGKSTLMRMINQNAVFAFPTHQLKLQEAERFRQAGFDVKVTPEVPASLPDAVKESLNMYHRMGGHKGANKLLRSIPEAAEYLEQLDDALRTKGILFTTHARLPFLNVKQDLIVIDEDISKTIFPQGNVEVTDLGTLVRLLKEETKSVFGVKRRIKWDGKDIDVAEDITILEQLIMRVTTCDMYVPHSMGGLPLRNYEYIQDLAIKHCKEFRSDVLGFLNSAHFTRIEDRITFVRTLGLPEDKKIFIFSATASRYIYNEAFKSRLHYIDTPAVKNQGVLYQLLAPSSRKALENPELRALYQEVAGKLPLLTFKKYEGEFENVVGTIGALEGLNSLEGQDLCVIATPHYDRNTYVLLAAALGYQLKAIDLSAPRYMKVSTDAAEFWFPSFVSKPLREIQLHLVQSESIQAIGRARLVRNAAVVIVISDFPIAQAMELELPRPQREKLDYILKNRKAS